MYIFGLDNSFCYSKGSVSSSTWIKENYGFQAGIFIVIYLQLLEGKHQLI